MLEMSLSKSIVGSTLSFSGSIKNLESHSFNGFMLVFITENQLTDPTYGVTWNFVFRDYGLNKTLSLAGLSTDTFSGSWSIPIGVNSANIQVVAAVYDTDTRNPTYGWPYAAQSVCDVCGHAVAVPEFPSILAYLLIATSISVIVLLLTRKQTRNTHKIDEHGMKHNNRGGRDFIGKFCNNIILPSKLHLRLPLSEVLSG